MAETDRTAILPAHIEDTVEAIAQLHAEHRRRATSFQKLIGNLIARAGRPSFIAWLAASMSAWVCLNLAMVAAGRPAIDEPPFAWLELFASLLALVMTVMILSTQRRDDELASYREQLTLELAILNDQKSAKVIELLEELRRDMPSVHDRVDHEAVAMTAPADPQALLNAIKDTDEELEANQAKA